MDSVFSYNVHNLLSTYPLENSILFLGFLGTRYVILKFYEENKSLLDNPYFASLLIFSVFYSYFKDMYVSLGICIVYIIFFTKGLKPSKDTNGLEKPLI